MKARLVRFGGSRGVTHVVAPFGRWRHVTACGLRLDRHWHRPASGAVRCANCRAAVEEISARTAGDGSSPSPAALRTETVPERHHAPGAHL